MIINSKFQAPRWLSSPHAQTLFAARLRKVERPPIWAERCATPDNDFIDLHCFGNPDGPQVMVFHGLEGSSRSPYACGLIKALIAQNLGGAVMHFRGCSGEPNKKVQSYHCGHTTDIAWLLHRVAVTRPGQPLLAVGFSIGAAALLNTLAQEKLPAELCYAIAVSTPFEPRSGAERMNTGISRIYQRSLIKDCVRSAKAKLASGVALPVDVEKLEQAKTFWEFDHHVTAPLHGFDSADDYYNRAAPRQRLRQIDRRCHIIHALDDPFFEPGMIPTDDELGPNTILELSQSGGHVGFVCGPLWRPVYWLEQRLTELLTTALNDA